MGLFLAREATFGLLANWGGDGGVTCQRGEILMGFFVVVVVFFLKSNPESTVLLHRDSISNSLCCKLPITVEKIEEIFFSFSFFFCLQRKKNKQNNIVQIKSSVDQKKLPQKKKKKRKEKDCILTGIMNEHKEIILCSTNKIVFTLSMYCQWPITRCLQ